VTSIVIARVIGPEGKGILSLSILAASVVFNSTNMGIGTGSGYFLGRRKVSLEMLAGTWLSLSLVIGAAVTAAALLLAPILAPRILPSVPVLYVSLAVASVPFLIFRYNFQSLFKAGDDFRRFNMIELVQPASSLVIFVVLINIFPERHVTAAVVAYLLANIAGGLTAIGFMLRVTRLRFHWSGGLVRSALGFGVQGYMANFLAFLNLRLDLLLVNLFLEPLHVGYYSIAVMAAEKMWYVPDALAVVLHPRVAHGSEEDANRDTARICRQTVLIVSAGCVVILLMGRFLVELLYSSRFLPAVAPLFLLLPGILTAGVGRVIGSDLLARGYPRINMWAGLVALVTNIGLNLAMIPRMGVRGAALATSISYSLHAAVLIIAFMRITDVPLRSLLAPGGEDLRLLVRGIRRLLTRGGRADGSSR
jgi:O-antigen/teichoic acid export membrane protein